jgi:hypothetical protein
MKAAWRIDAELIMNDSRPQPWMAVNAAKAWTTSRLVAVTRNTLKA